MAEYDVTTPSRQWVVRQPIDLREGHPQDWYAENDKRLSAAQ